MKDWIVSPELKNICLLTALFTKAFYDLVVYFRLKSGKYVKSGKKSLSRFNFGAFFGLGLYLIVSGLFEYKEVGVNSSLIIGFLYLILFIYRLNKYEILFKNKYFLYKNSGSPFVFKYKDVDSIIVNDEIIDIYIKDKHFTSSLNLPQQETTKDFVVQKMGDKVSVS